MKMFIRYSLLTLLLSILQFDYVHNTPVKVQVLSEVPLAKRTLKQRQPQFYMGVSPRVNALSITNSNGNNAILNTQKKKGLDSFTQTANGTEYFEEIYPNPKNRHDEESNKDNYDDEQLHLKVILQDEPFPTWPFGKIPYHFDTSFDSILAERVRDVMDYLESISCIQFKALSERKPRYHPWISIYNNEKQRECVHHARRKSSGEVVLTLGLDCLKKRDILHSLLHAIGFNDEVTHPHRDQYIRIMWENIQPRYHELFGVKPRHSKLMVDYDPMSIMQFHDRAYSKNGRATTALLLPGLQIQQTYKLSQLDKMKLNLAFGHECNRRTVDDLYDTCKNVLTKERTKANHDSSELNSKLKMNRGKHGANNVSNEPNSKLKMKRGKHEANNVSNEPNNSILKMNREKHGANNINNEANSKLKTKTGKNGANNVSNEPNSKLEMNRGKHGAKNVNNEPNSKLKMNRGKIGAINDSSELNSKLKLSHNRSAEVKTDSGPK